MPDLSASDIIKFSGLLLEAGMGFYKRQAETEGKTVLEVLAEAEATWKQSRDEAVELQNLGHE